MLSAPSSSRDASLPQKPAASSTTAASGASDAAAAPFDSVLAGLTPARSDKTDGSSKAPAKGDPANNRGARDSAGGKAPDPATTTGKHVWSAPATWLQPTDASAAGSEEPVDTEGAQAVPIDEEQPAGPEVAITATIAPVQPPSEPVAASVVVAPGATCKDETTTEATDGARPRHTFEEDMDGALPDSPGALYSGAAAKGAWAARSQPQDSARVVSHSGRGPEGAGHADEPAATSAVPTTPAVPTGSAAHSVETMSEDAADPMPSAPTSAGRPVSSPKVSPERGDITRLPKVYAQTEARPADGTSAAPAIAQPPPAPAAAPFAAPMDGQEPPAAKDKGVSLENIVQAVGREVVAPALKVLGIDPAKVGSTMEIVAADPSPLTPDALAPEAEPEIAAASRGSFDRVMQVTDAVRPSERSAVNVRLDFGEAGPLNVHIAMRDGRVHTMFRCDSAQLRDTLTAAWSNFVQQGDVAALPLAEPMMLPLRATTGSHDGGRNQDSFNQPNPDGHPGRQAGSREDAGQGAFGRPLRRQAPVSSTSPAAPTARGGSSSHLSAHA